MQPKTDCRAGGQRGDLCDEATHLMYETTRSGPGAPSPGYNSMSNVEDVSTHPDRRASGREQCANLPLFQVVLLCILSTQDPIAFFTIFPFINEQVEKVGHVQPENVGFWSGVIESLFSVTQAIVILSYGYFGVRFRRKALLVTSLFGSGLVSSLFGFSQHVWHMILIRCVTGLFSGSNVIVRTMLFEHCSKSTQATIFSWYTVIRHLGSILGPLVGGWLANLDRFELMAQYDFLRQYPYAAPTMFCGGLSLVMAITAACALDETLQKGSESVRPDRGSMNIREMLQIPRVASALGLYGQVTLINMSFTAIIAVFLYTPVDLGGLGFMPDFISLVQALLGLAQVVCTIMVFPRLQRHYGNKWVLQSCAWALPLYLASFPLQNFLLRFGENRLFWLAGPFFWLFGSGVWMFMVSVQLYLNDVAPDPTINGALNGLAMSISCSTRAFMPAVFAALYALGVRSGIFGGQLAWICLIVLSISLIMFVHGMRVVQVDDESHPDDREGV